MWFWLFTPPQDLWGKPAKHTYSNGSVYRLSITHILRPWAPLLSVRLRLRDCSRGGWCFPWLNACCADDSCDSAGLGQPGSASPYGDPQVTCIHTSVLFIDSWDKTHRKLKSRLTVLNALISCFNYTINITYNPYYRIIISTPILIKRKKRTANAVFSCVIYGWHVPQGEYPWAIKSSRNASSSFWLSGFMFSTPAHSG